MFKIDNSAPVKVVRRFTPNQQCRPICYALRLSLSNCLLISYPMKLHATETNRFNPPINVEFLLSYDEFFYYFSMEDVALFERVDAKYFILFLMIFNARTIDD